MFLSTCCITNSFYLFYVASINKFLHSESLFYFSIIQGHTKNTCADAPDPSGTAQTREGWKKRQKYLNKQTNKKTVTLFIDGS